MEPISPKVRATTIAVTLLLSLTAPIVILRLVTPDLPNPPFFGRTLNPPASATPSVTEAMETGTATVSVATVTLPATLTPRRSAGLFEGAYVDGVVDLPGGRSMIRIIIPRPVNGQYRMEDGFGILRPYECFVPEWYSNRLYCHGSRIARGATILVRVYQYDDQWSGLVFETQYYVRPIAPTSTPLPNGGATGPSPPQTPTTTPTATRTPTRTATPSLTPSATPSPSPTPSLVPTPTPSLTATETLPPTSTPSPTSTPTPEPPSETPTPTETPIPPTDTPSSNLDDAAPTSRKAFRTVRVLSCGTLA